MNDVNMIASPFYLIKMIKLLELFENVKIKVSDDGRVFTLDHKNIRKNGRIDNRKGKELKRSLDRCGYSKVTLSSNGIRKTYFIHQLVALAFLPNPDKKPTINHLNGNKNDNRLENLEWATYKEQKIHAIHHNLCDKNLAILAEYNKSNSKKIYYRGKVYPSIREACRKNNVHGRIIKRDGVVLNDNSIT